MKKILSAMMFFAVLRCLNSVVFAAELLEVTPAVVGSAVSVDISADIAMTYTFYKIPGQARAVVDIAEADPEKVEPLIVVNKGAVSSISVDKTLISGIVVSRIIFNLVSEADISVSATPDRKHLTVTFSGLPVPPGNPAPKQGSMPLPKPAQSPEPAARNGVPAFSATPHSRTNPDEDSLDVDEPVAKSPVPPDKTAIVTSSTPLAATAPPLRIPKLETVIPAAIAQLCSQPLSIKKITTGETYVEIRTNVPVTDYKAIRIAAPDRLVIDIASKKTNQKPRTVAIGKFGISKARIGVSPNNIRIVIDADKVGFPAYTITTSEEGLRINFK